MKTIKNSKEITTLEVDDVVIISNFRHVVCKHSRNGSPRYYLNYCLGDNDRIFEILNLKKRDFVGKLGIDANCNCDFPETKSLEALTAIVSALFKEYEKQKELPKTWEEFCDRYPVTNNEVVLSHNSVILTFDDFPNTSTERDPDVDRNFCPSFKEAEAFLALMQLRQLRKAYVKNWEPDWSEPSDKYCINFWKYKFKIAVWGQISHVLSFPTHELAEQFLINFKDLIEIAKPLL